MSDAQEPRDPVVRLALIGAGRIGRVHARSIAADPRLELVVTANPTVEKAQDVAAVAGGDAVSDPDAVFAEPYLGRIDGVVVASATPTHIGLIGAAARHGLPVLCEKPLDLDLGTVRAAQERLRDSRVPVVTGFNRRFDPSFAAAHRRVTEGEIGRLEQLTIVSRDPEPPSADYIASSGGIFRDMTIHDFDMARFFVPDIVEVTATATGDLHGDHDSAVTVLRGRGGELVTVINSRHSAAGYDQRLEAFGSAGGLTVNNMTPTTVTSSGSLSTGAADPYQVFFTDRYAEAYAAEMAAFADVVRAYIRGHAEPRDCDPAVPGFGDGLAALELAAAAEESVATGRSVQVS